MDAFALRFCGMVELPTSVSESASSTSPNSAAISRTISSATDCAVPAMRASRHTHSAKWSAIDRAGTAIGVRPTRSATPRWISGPTSPKVANVPAAPPVIDTSRRGSTSRMRRRWREKMSAHTAAL